MFSHLRLGHRLAAGFGLVLLLMCVAVASALWQARRIHDSTQFLVDRILPAAGAIRDITATVDDIRRYEFRFLMARDEAEMSRVDAKRLELTRTLREHLDRYGQAHVVDGDDQRLLAATRQAADAYLALWTRVEPLARAGKTDPQAQAQAEQLMERDLFKTFTQASEAVDAWWAHHQQLGTQRSDEAGDTYHRALVLLLSLSATALAVGVVAALAIGRAVVRPITEAAAVARAVAHGDLTRDVTAHGRDETAELLRSLGEMTRGLRSIVSQVRTASDSIATGSSQIATGNADLSQRTEEQASNLQQTAASMEQLAGNVRNNTDSAVQAARLAGDAAEAAQRGGAVVSEVVGTMREIAASSGRIADIIGVIDGIAFQTNILALNAAVEAARAGEQGRGFAVVAGEVRTLAQRSADAAKEIKTLITGSVEKVEAGTQQVDRARASMDDIVRQVQQVTQIIAEISSASQEQNAGIQQVGGAVQQLDQVTQQNAALVEQSAAAADSLKTQAARLAATVAAFRLTAERHAPGEAPAMSAPVLPVMARSEVHPANPDTPHGSTAPSPVAPESAAGTPSPAAAAHRLPSRHAEGPATPAVPAGAAGSISTTPPRRGTTAAADAAGDWETF